jgi:HPt (histidine-containing phosphotransfer) domain-containing protein
MPDPAQLAELLKAKAALVNQREREVYRLRLGRERMLAWLHAFHRLSMEVRSETPVSMCSAWASVMIRELHFQTAAAFRYSRRSGELSLLAGKSQMAIDATIALDEPHRRALHECAEGVFNGKPEHPGAPAPGAALAEVLGLQRFLWCLLPHDALGELLLVSGVSARVAATHEPLPEDDLVYFKMVARHLAVLISNGNLVSALEAVTRNLRELFDHMRQAIVAFDAAGTIVGAVSRQATLLFERASLEGCRVRDLLYPDAAPYDVDATAFDEWLDMAFATPADDWHACERYAPSEATFVQSRGDAIPLELEFRPLVHEGRTVRVMLLCTDVSVKRKLETAVRTQEDENARRLAAMRKVLTSGAQVFVAFVETARARLARCHRILSADGETLPGRSIDELFREVHTIRGEARAFDLKELEVTAKRLEARFEQLRARATAAGYVLSAAVRQELTTALNVAGDALERGCDVLVAACPSGSAVFDQITVQRSDLLALIELLGPRTDRIGMLATRLTSVPFGVVAAAVLEGAASWAESEGKVARLDLSPRELMVPQGLARVLPGVLAHLVRNAIAHGIETPEARRRAGKNEQGRVALHAEEIEGGVCVTVEDDGAGLDAEHLRASAGRAGYARDTSPTELAFLPGVSTRELAGDVAGQGVGLDAARTALREIGYDVAVAFEPGRYTRFTVAPKGSVRRCA